MFAAYVRPEMKHISRGKIVKKQVTHVENRRTSRCARVNVRGGNALIGILNRQQVPGEIYNFSTARDMKVKKRGLLATLLLRWQRRSREECQVLNWQTFPYEMRRAEFN
jgi:hypothetical protein